MFETTGMFLQHMTAAMKGGICLLILAVSYIDIVTSQGNVTTAEETTGEVTHVSKAFISLAILGGGFLIAIGVAKLVDNCYDRAALRDDDSDISEHTRQLIKARLALSRFKRPNKDKKKKKKKMSEKEVKKSAKMYFKLWSKNAKNRGAKRKRDEPANNLLYVNGSMKKFSAHVTFVDEVNKRGNDDGAVISIAVPTLKQKPTPNVSKGGTRDSPRTPVTVHNSPKHTDSKITTVSGIVAERENSGKTTPTKDYSGTITHVKEQSGRTTPVKENSGRTSPFGSGRTTPVKISSGRSTPVLEAKRPTQSGKAMPSNDKKPTPEKTPSLKESLKSSPLVPASGRPASGKDIPRFSSPTKNIKTPTAAPNRPKTAPNRKPVTKVVAVKAAETKTPSTPKLGVKDSQSKNPKGVPRIKSSAGAKGPPGGSWA